MPATRRAFSLVELVIVILVLGILAGAAAPRYASALRWKRLESSAYRIAADLRRARDEAVQASSCLLYTSDAADE